MTITQLSIPYPDFRISTIIQPEEFDINNGSIVDKVNLIINTLNGITGPNGSSLSSTEIVALIHTTVDPLLADLQSQINTLNTSVTNHGTRITTLETTPSVASIEVLTADPVTPYVGQIWIRSGV